MYDLSTIKRMNTAAVKKWYESEKEKLDSLNAELAKLEEEKRSKLSDFGKSSKLAKQMVDLALLANGMLKGADLDKFVKRSVELIK